MRIREFCTEYPTLGILSFEEGYAYEHYYDPALWWCVEHESRTPLIALKVVKLVTPISIRMVFRTSSGDVFSICAYQVWEIEGLWVGEWESVRTITYLKVMGTTFGRVLLGSRLSFRFHSVPGEGPA